ncbi:YehS family protein [Rhodanobacter koreensis]
MINNDVLRAIRYMLDLSDGKVVEITHLTDANFPIAKEDVQAFLKKDEEPGYVECSSKVLAHFLDGLVVYRRGRDESQPPRPVEKRVTNNVVLKKLRVAFELKDVDMHQILEAAGFPISKPELSALFRQPDHKNFRLCGDQLLRNFLKGLTLRLRGNI